MPRAMDAPGVRFVGPGRIAQHAAYHRFPHPMPLAMDDRLVAFAESAIRDHLVARPESADTLEGIHRWWIAWPESEVSPIVTRSALERLLAAGEVETMTVGRNVLWRRARRPG